MYTQCPECEIAFRVTADVLKQAAGMVRCGGCAHPFNALAFLSESMPDEAAAPDAHSTVSELTPETLDTDNRLPRTISARQSAALLKTLDQLAGPDVRIEDTGVEWRVLDEDEAAAPAAQDDDAGQVNIVEIDETLDNSETPIDELLTSAPGIVDSPELFDASANRFAQTPVEELRFDDNTPLPDDFDLDDESSYVPQPEPEAETTQPEPAAPAPEIALSQPDEWQDILGEFEELAQEVAAPIEIVEVADVQEIAAEEPENVNSSGDTPLDVDTQFALQAEVMGIDISGIHELEEDPELPEDKISNEFQNELEVALEEEMRVQLENSSDPEEESPEPEEEVSQLELIEEQVEPIVESHTIEDELALLDDGEPTDNSDEPDKHPMPPMTDEEHTVNMLIDQELMALAVEDEDGFASTIVISQKNAEKLAAEAGVDLADDGFDENADASGDGSSIEKIIMEGEFVRSAVDSEKLATDTAAAASLSSLAETSISDHGQSSRNMRYRMVGGIVALVLLLAVQAMHQSREALATIPAFNDTVGEVYRAIGQPVQPAWDISGWRFEATKGSAEGDEEELTVYSRIGNESDGPLPYPLIGISLTDRFEETIGSRVLDPAEYLSTDLDPTKLVEPGKTFDALITIKSATAEAAGFKLNVCYRLSDGRLRCATDDFK